VIPIDQIHADADDIALHPQLERIYESGTAVDANGTVVPVRDFIARAESELIYRQVLASRSASAVEIGMACGASSLSLADAMSRVSSQTRLISIDPHQTSGYKRIGLAQLEQAGLLDNSVLIEEPSQLALPRLVAGGDRFDFAFIDGYHTLDHCLVDFFYVDMLLRTGGIVVFDDVGWPAVNHVVRFVAANRRYTIVDSVRRTPLGQIRGVVGGWPRTLRQPQALRTSLRRVDRSFAVALRKDADDDRRWDHFVRFAP